MALRRISLSISSKFLESLPNQSQRLLHSTSQLRKAVVLDGKKVASEIQAELAVEVQSIVSKTGKAPHLSLVRVGSDPASGTYLRNKANAAKKIGVISSTHQLPEDVSQSELLRLISELNNDTDVNGILVQLPVPAHIEEKVVCNAVSPYKDVDGFHETNIGRFVLDVPCLGPCTPLGVIELIKRYGIDTFGKKAVVCGRSKNVGLPIAMLLHGDGVRKDAAFGGLDCTTTICHRYTPQEDLYHYLSTADIVVTAAGIPNLITGDKLKAGACVVDVAINRVKDEETGKMKLVGDCHFESCSSVAGHISPVPGGVGPLTVAMLMKNTVEAAKQQHKL